MIGTSMRYSNGDDGVTAVLSKVSRHDVQNSSVRRAVTKVVCGLLGLFDAFCPVLPSARPYLPIMGGTILINLL